MRRAAARRSTEMRRAMPALPASCRHRHAAGARNAELLGLLADEILQVCHGSPVGAFVHRLHGYAQWRCAVAKGSSAALCTRAQTRPYVASAARQPELKHQAEPFVLIREIHEE